MASRAAKIIDGGKLVIPADFRRKLGIEAGGTVIVELTEDGLRVRSRAAAAREAQALVRALAPNAPSLADALIAERRVEAERE